MIVQAETPNETTKQEKGSRTPTERAGGRSGVHDAREANVAGEAAASDTVAVAAEIAALRQGVDLVITTVTGQNHQIADLLARDEVLGRVHQRLAAYEQDDRQRSFLEPLARKVAPLHRRLVDQQVLAERALRSVPRSLRKHSAFYWVHGVLDSARVELETTLSDFGIEVFTSNKSTFDRSRQEALERIPTDDPVQIGTIARRIAPGFRIGDRIIIPERVAVYVKRNGQEHHSPNQ